MLTKISRKNKEIFAEYVFNQLGHLWPNAHCELIYNTPFQLALAVLLSAQTTDKAVNKALSPLFEKNNLFGPRDLVMLGEQGFREAIKSIGLAPTKARHSVAMAQKLCDLFGEELPRERADLEQLPGIGRKSANVVLNVLHEEPVMPVDTHVARVSSRIGLVEQNISREKIEEQLMAIVPKKWAIRAHHLLIFHGRYLCQARKPLCGSCPLAAQAMCQYFQESKTS